MVSPEKIDAIGNEIAIRWSDGSEDYYPMHLLRRYSPSAENQGEKDLLGHSIYTPKENDVSGVTVTNWAPVGSYAILFHFSDGHRTGIYAFDYLKKIAEAIRLETEGDDAV
ncbi:MAG: DUF971 domain-containing protein [Verrucomicrobia bacterium]|nr:DUF971 domain-containing protein [Verrucomicrobiota bacterium]